MLFRGLQISYGTAVKNTLILPSKKCEELGGKCHSLYNLTSYCHYSSNAADLCGTEKCRCCIGKFPNFQDLRLFSFMIYIFFTVSAPISSTAYGRKHRIEIYILGGINKSEYCVFIPVHLNTLTELCGVLNALSL